ncbi:MAG: DNA repair protein RecN [Dysgonamonadaceae bacterium]|jgi:DNA repair protein RecN (Recombination protein N)|nr:DNA repair protein RecN [Dysgonamonadaceae bacterium]
MLKNLTIRNYALISHLEIDFSKGFSVITGETGAGKSIILGALSLILGQRADAKSIKPNENKCLIEGVFDVSSYGLESFFTEHDLEFDAQNCILRREIWSSGKSRAFINDQPVGLNDLKDLGAFLIDIHSQHHNLLLGDTKFQLQALDVLAENRALRTEYALEYKQFITIRRQLQELQEKAAAHSSEQDYLRFQYQQLAEAKLQAGEQSELEEEQKTLSHLEEIKTGLFAIENLLSSDETGILSGLKEGLTAAQNIQKISNSAGQIVERLQSAYFDLKDLNAEIHHQQEKLELNPERLQQVNERLDLIYSLQTKHRTDSIENLIALKNEMEAQLNEIDHYDEEIARLQQQFEVSEAKIDQLSGKLSETRRLSAGLLEKSLVERVSGLGMPALQFQVEIKTKETPDSTGKDDIRFLFSANRNNPMLPVAQIASGGEISRLMLGIKALIAGAAALPTIIFDEIDTGVSGEIADKMGNIMQNMGEVMQVIAITHLPQIAAKGEAQYFVYKEENNDFIETHIRRLSLEERIREIAQMLSGSELTEAAIENAKVLLKNLN